MVELASGAPYEHGSLSGPPPVARRFWQIHHRQRIRLWGVAFVLPTLLFFAVFKYGPMVWAIDLSFNSYDMVSAPRFVGLENYRALAEIGRASCRERVWRWVVGVSVETEGVILVSGG